MPSHPSSQPCQFQRLAVPRTPPGRTASLEDAMKWADRGLDRLLLDNSQRDQVLSALSNRTVHTSSCFSGVGAPEISDGIIAASASVLLSSSPASTRVTPLTFVSRYCIEVNKKAQQELLLLTDTAPHTNVATFKFAHGSIRAPGPENPGPRFLGHLRTS